MLVVVKFLNIELLLTDQLDCQCKGTGRVRVIVKVNLPMDRAGFEHLGLQRDFNRNRLFLFHGVLSSLNFILCEKSPSPPWSGPFDILSAEHGQSRATRGATRPLAGQAPADRAAQTEVVPGWEDSEYFRDACFAPLIALQAGRIMPPGPHTLRSA
jgi:hypothetical protein